MSKLRPNPSRCVLCGSTDRVELNHIGGRNHVIWITAPFCRKHHNEFHLRLRLAEIDLRYTDDRQERFRRARQATLIFLLMLEECAKEPVEELLRKPIEKIDERMHDPKTEVNTNALQQSRG